MIKKLTPNMIAYFFFTLTFLLSSSLALHAEENRDPFFYSLSLLEDDFRLPIGDNFKFAFGGDVTKNDLPNSFVYLQSSDSNKFRDKLVGNLSTKSGQFDMIIPDLPVTLKYRLKFTFSGKEFFTKWFLLRKVECSGKPEIIFTSGGLFERLNDINYLETYAGYQRLYQVEFKNKNLNTTSKDILVTLSSGTPKWITLDDRQYSTYLDIKMPSKTKETTFEVNSKNKFCNEKSKNKITFINSGNFSIDLAKTKYSTDGIVFSGKGYKSIEKSLYIMENIDVNNKSSFTNINFLEGKLISKNGSWESKIDAHFIKGKKYWIYLMDSKKNIIISRDWVFNYTPEKATEVKLIDSSSGFMNEISWEVKNPFDYFETTVEVLDQKGRTLKNIIVNSLKDKSIPRGKFLLTGNGLVNFYKLNKSDLKKFKVRVLVTKCEDDLCAVKNLKKTVTSNEIEIGFTDFSYGDSLTIYTSRLGTKLARPRPGWTPEIIRENSVNYDLANSISSDSFVSNSLSEIRFKNGSSTIDIQINRRSESTRSDPAWDVSDFKDFEFGVTDYTQFNALGKSGIEYNSYLSATSTLGSTGVPFNVYYPSPPSSSDFPFGINIVNKKLYGKKFDYNVRGMSTNLDKGSLNSEVNFVISTIDLKD